MRDGDLGLRAAASVAGSLRHALALADRMSFIVILVLAARPWGHGGPQESLRAVAWMRPVSHEIAPRRMYSFEAGQANVGEPPKGNNAAA